MRVAIVHDWLYTIGGAERVLREMLRCFPNAQIFTLFDALDEQQRAYIGFRRACTSFLQSVPGISKSHRLFLPLMPLAVEQFNLSGYDLVISSSYAVAKGVVTGPDQMHIAYVHSPMRYAWDLQHEYLREMSGLRRIQRWAACPMLHYLRMWDTSSSVRPNALIANSSYIARRISKTFGRNATVIHPPVDVHAYGSGLKKARHFLTAGRLVSYKNVRPVIEAFRLLPDLELVVAGDGPDGSKLRSLAGPNVTFTGHVDDTELRRLMATARALVFAAEEDFGIVPVEAQAEGTPVLALGRGGARETVVASGPGRTGMFFAEPSAPVIAACVNAFVAEAGQFSPEACQRHARRFATERFRAVFRTFVDSEIERWRNDHPYRAEDIAQILLPAAE
jgi:glycosyltransferase involved in cell wall biosynthesis